jgi:hypothetical protein
MYILRCAACDLSFPEDEVIVPEEESLAELQNGSLTFVEGFCPGCGSDQLEDT